ncbi:MAG: Fe2+-dependent dioxygenase [Pseudomonadota bacterium]
MIVFLEDVLSPAHVGAFVKVLEAEHLFESGSRTAGRLAKSQKQNLQALNAQPEVARILKQVREDLSQHSVFRSFAVPAKLGRVMVSRYEPSMQYGSHFDDAFIDGVRTDLSFTVFLSDPDSYQGGELELTTPSGSQAIKLPAGCAIVYPSDHLHAVLPVTSGVRLAVVGWVRSRVKSSEQRQLLHDLDNATAALGDEVSREVIMRLKFVRNNLLRMWSD